MKKLFILPLLAITFNACSTIDNPQVGKFYCFDTMVEAKIYDINTKQMSGIDDLLRSYDALTDNYRDRDVNNVYTINNTNEDVVVDEKLYNLLTLAFDMKNRGITYFNPLVGSLSEKWKSVLRNGETLDSVVINEELSKINTSELVFKDNNTVQRIGDAEIDLGAIAKGYVLDEIHEYLKSINSKQYLINAGSSSILLGEKNTKDGLFSIGLKDLPNKYLQLKNCVISTSSISEQGVTINGVTYSHIINPLNGSAINLHDAVIVVSQDGYLGDVMSTNMMNNTIDEIKSFETQFNLKTIVIDDGKVSYQHPDLGVSSH